MGNCKSRRRLTADRSRHSNDLHDETVPAGSLKRGLGIENLDNTGFGAHALAPVDGFMALQRRLCLGESLNFPQQTALIFFNLNKQMAFRRPGCPESFFDSAWRPS